MRSFAADAPQCRAHAARQRLTADFDWHTVPEETAQVYLAAKHRGRQPLSRLPIVEHALSDKSQGASASTSSKPSTMQPWNISKSGIAPASTLIPSAQVST
jgi:hypothetical protein